MTVPLIKKLGLKAGMTIRLIHAPTVYDRLLGTGMDEFKIQTRGKESIDFIQLFTNSLSELEETLPQLKSQIKKNGCIWISWYKKASGKPSELNDQIVRATALAAGLVDVKVCSVNEDWSGLKLVFRLKDRG